MIFSDRIFMMLVKYVMTVYSIRIHFVTLEYTLAARRRQERLWRLLGEWDKKGYHRPKDGKENTGQRVWRAHKMPGDCWNALLGAGKPSTPKRP